MEDKKAKDAPFVWAEELNGELRLPMATKRKYRSKKVEFLGWGSKPLVQFLNSIGKDGSEKRSQYDVTTIVTEYVKKNGLLHPVKKKRILCDERLQSLFGRKSISRIKIYDLLEAHFAENQDISEDDLDFFPDDDQEEEDQEHASSGGACRRETNSNLDKKSCQKRNSMQTLRSSFAAIIPENIKLIYLKRSLVMNLLKEPESFETKMVGSFVRVKSDPNDYFQKNSHQLLPVTGVKKASDIDDSRTSEFLLQVSNLMKDIRICMLSDDNFSEEECEDLRQRVKEGSMRKPTIVELEEKARLLHEDITKHWIMRELALLQNLIDRANEKGWRRELFEYLERRQNLQKPSEQSRLLREVPKVIPDAIGLETTLTSPDNTKEGSDGLQRTLDSEASKILPLTVKETISTQVADQMVRADNVLVSVAEKRLVVDSENNKSLKGTRESDATAGQIIDLSSDEDEDLVNASQIPDIDPGSLIWHYKDPQGDIQGPFPLTSLKRWSDARYFHPYFKVWQRGQTEEKAVSLSSLLCRYFPVDP